MTSHSPRVPWALIAACLLPFVLVSPLRAQDDAKAQAHALLVQGGQALNAGQLDRALSLFQKSLDINERIGNNEGAAEALLSIGDVYADLGQHKKATDYYGRCLGLVEGTKSPLLPFVYNSIGRSANELGHPDIAIEFLQRCLGMFEAAGKKPEYASTLDMIGQSYARLRKFDEALQNQMKALEIFRGLGNPRDIARLLTNIGATAKAKGDTNLAIKYLEESLTLTRRIAGPDRVLAAVTNLALLYYDVGKLEPSAAAFAEAIGINEAVSRQVRDASRLGEYQDWFRSSLYRRYAHVLIDQKKPEEALAVLERGRIQGLARQAAQNRADYSKLLGPADGKRLKDATAAFAAASKDVQQIEGIEFLVDGQPDSPQKQEILGIRRRYDEAEHALITLRDELFRTSPAYRRLSGSAPPSIAELKQLAIRHPDTLYLQWAVGAERTSLLFALTEDGVKSFVLPIGETELTKQVKEWREAIEKADEKAEADHARAIYKSLFSAAEEAGLFAFNKYSRLVLVGDGPLLEVPFAALLNGGDKRLVEVMPISVSSSFGVLLWPDDREKGSTPILIAADPVADGAPSLPAARTEGRAVAGLFPDAKIYVGELATRKFVLPDLPGASILHFATHGLLDPEDGLKSGLLLADEKGTDGFQLLTASELINTKLAAQLAVLSACETGKGQQSGGEGLLGLTWAFRAAGCPCTVASLWSVDDEATGKLMVAFYSALRDGKRKDEALRDAMVAVKKTQPQPQYWAAFQLNGDTSPIKL